MTFIPEMSRTRAVAEIFLVLFVFLFLGFYILMFYLYGFEGFSLATLEYVTTPEGQGEIFLPGLFFSPVSMLITFAAVWGLQKSRGESLWHIGLSPPESWGWAWKWGAVFAVLLYVISVLALLGLDSLGFKQTSQDFLFIKDNPFYYIFAITAIAWVSAGFGEEVVFRGFILRNLTVLFGDSKIGLGVAVVAQAAVFAILHLNQDVGGAIAVFILALFFGGFFLKVGRNLWPLIIAHGLFDSFQFSLLYFFG